MSSKRPGRGGGMRTPDWSTKGKPWGDGGQGQRMPMLVLVLGPELQGASAPCHPWLGRKERWGGGRGDTCRSWRHLGSTSLLLRVSKVGSPGGAWHRPPCSARHCHHRDAAGTGPPSRREWRVWGAEIARSHVCACGSGEGREPRETLLWGQVFPHSHPE